MSYLRLQDIPNGSKMKSPEGGEKGGKKMTYGLRNMDFLLQYLGEFNIQSDSILKIGMKFSRKKMNG